tara:strand:+ start:49739 stop:50059 length:321 start_codon:yes stop_codon:yes gene_type:complete
MSDKVEKVLIDGGISWLVDDLLNKYPIENIKEWELDRVSNKYPMIVSTVTNPINDPWGRPTIPWNFREGDGNKYNWIKGSMTVKDYTMFRYTTIEGTPVKLWMKKA